MKKMIFIIVFILLIGIGLSIKVYVDARSPFNEKTEEAITLAKSQEKISKVDSASIYNGTKSYVVLIGKNAEKEKVIVWVPNKKKDKMITQKWANGISKEKAVNKLKNEESTKEILSVKLGLEEVGPVWEITYLNNKDQLNYYYLLFESGEWWKKIENL
ncbi:uncharacterized protein YpmB [Bacillus pakistanensis]|uniref:Uncharacterized protein YpmB n=1 Tax=Rossellomorea pakistanensis TaxID=992288 RepID=A0ABS2N8Y1_9BACI|nr:DUF5590 domain-containing protein [Bacillus pakistanensis]MBM7584317.1 uncharacterized protein YpmB [Bacillus pakistanensis]